MQMEAIRDALREMKEGTQDLLSRVEEELGIYKSYETMPLPEAIESKFTMACRDMRILISRMDYMITKVFVDNSERSLVEKKAAYADFKADMESKQTTFDELLAMMTSFNSEHYKRLKRETEAEERRLADEEDYGAIP